jgi:hypothetical protein
MSASLSLIGERIRGSGASGVIRVASAAWLGDVPSIPRVTQDESNLFF